MLATSATIEAKVISYFILFHSMFVLQPNGSQGGAGGESGSFVSQQLWNFGTLGLYFGALHLAFLFMSGSGSSEGSDSSSNPTPPPITN